LPVLQPYRVPLCLVAIVVITLANLRGVRESGAIFSLPTYFFIATFAVMIGYGIFQAFSGSLGTVAQQPGLQLFGPHGALPADEREPVTLFFLMAAFASGCTALTGVEAISNGVPAFRKPESNNARTTLTVMITILGTMFVGITFLATRVGGRAAHGRRDDPVRDDPVAGGAHGVRRHQRRLLLGASGDLADFAVGGQHGVCRFSALDIADRPRPLPAAAVCLAR